MKANPFWRRPAKSFSNDYYKHPTCAKSKDVDLHEPSTVLHFTSSIASSTLKLPLYWYRRAVASSARFKRYQCVNRRVSKIDKPNGTPVNIRFGVCYCPMFLKLKSANCFPDFTEVRNGCCSRMLLCEHILQRSKCLGTRLQITVWI